MVIDTLKKCSKLLDVRQKKHFTIMTLFLMVSAVLELVGFLAILPLISLLVDYDSMSASRSVRFLHELLAPISPEAFILVVLVLSVVLIMFSGGMAMLGIYFSQRFLRRLNAELSARFYSTFLSQELEFFYSRDPSEFIRNINNVSDHLAFDVFGSAAIVISRVTQIFVIILLLGYVNIVVTVTVSAVIFVCYFLIYFVVKGRIAAISSASFQNHKDVIQHISGTYHSYRNIIINDSSERFVGSFLVLKKKISSQNASIETIGALPRYVIEVIGISLLLVTAYFLGTKNNNSGEFITVLGLFGVSAYKILPSAQQSYHAINRMVSAGAAYTKIESELTYPRRGENSSENEIAITKIESIVFSGVSCSISGKPILRDLTFTLSCEAGGIVRLAGESGSGKSTLMDIMIGLRKADCGSVEISGINISEIELNSYWQNIAFVGSDGYLFKGTVEENIRLFSKGASEQDLAFVCSMCGIPESECGFSRGYEISEAGANISSGQASRIFVARALLKTPQVLFMDEAFSSLDLLSSQRILRGIQRMERCPMVVLITHRPEECESYIKVVNVGTSSRD